MLQEQLKHQHTSGERNNDLQEIVTEITHEPLEPSPGSGPILVGGRKPRRKRERLNLWCNVYSSVNKKYLYIIMGFFKVKGEGCSV